MLIPILPPDGSTPATWAMIELQGEIETNLNGGVDRTERLDVGTIELVPGTVRYNNCSNQNFDMHSSLTHFSGPNLRTMHYLMECRKLCE